MKLLLAGLILLLVASDVLGLNMGLAPGLSIKNAALYLAAAVLVLNMVLGEGIRIELRMIHACFVVLIAYAIFTWIVAALIIEYPNYSLVGSAFPLKTNLIDPVIFFIVFFYGARTIGDAMFLAKVLLASISAANLIAALDSFGIVYFGITRVDDEGLGVRIFGAFGHANETAALIAATLPALIALARSSGGLTRWLWLLGLLASAAVLAGTASRGAVAGLLIGGVWGAFLCRRYLPVSRIALWAIAAMILVVPILLLVSSEFGGLLQERFIEQTFSGDAASVSSGRTQIWGAAIGRMMASPITLITGFGWDVYEVMPFRYAPHNHYLWLWFDLGLVGLGSFLLIYRQVLRQSNTALDVAEAEIRTYLIAFIFGFLTFVAAVFFAHVFRPWIYFWAYVGLSMRLVVELLRASRPGPATGAAPAQPPAAPAAYGWTASTGQAPRGPAP